MGVRIRHPCHPVPVDFRRIVSAAFDPVLVPVGSGAGQGGETQVIFCAGHDQFSDRFPLLPQADDQPRGLGCCIDLVVERSDDGTVTLELEGMPLAQTLRSVGIHDAADAVERAAGAPLETSLPVYTEALSRLFPAASE